ncbi:XTP/dITP diphosphohydrolase [Nonlabens dokdonensis]|jgi:XTP/dITP diphosphohydrolase|uniref:dITP/XTP pyrophosphatase n=2 Tax=Nonlabens dokdonensis TaxID=328515 RepID=L7WEG0_NONDD|nr:non-canonical purine NTP diphosphatase [Nonlabens dokdonensis]AGC78519.1 nucleoside-triphosphatase [Nonlabens dokdonensis DSW-6]PZX38262.1 XTP/dITP diphosphohydrolase [Nonlabens dokdonensis]
MEIIFATHNENKLKEVQVLMPSHVKLVSLKDLGFEEDIPETADTIAGNAIQKVEYLRNRFDLPIFADDTGLIVDSLDGEPGVYSARYAGEQKNSEDNMDLLLDKLTNNNDRKARFITAIALHLNHCQTLFEGICEGTILKERKGDKGFGYDPIFQPDGYTKSFAQMTLTEKGEISHRAKALSKLIDYLKDVN